MYLDGEPYFNNNSQIYKHFEDRKLIIQELKQFAKEINIAIIVTLACREKEWSYKSCKEIAKTSDIILDFDKLQRSNIRGLHRQRMRVLKTHDGSLGTYDLLFSPNTLAYDFF